MRRRSRIALALAGIGAGRRRDRGAARRSGRASPPWRRRPRPRRPRRRRRWSWWRRPGSDSAAPAHRLAGTIRARTETDLGFRVGGKLLRASGRGRGRGGGRRRGGDARRHRPAAAARGRRGGALGGADRAREGRDRPRPRDDAGEEGLGERPGHRRAHRRRRGAARAAPAGGAQRRAGGERALLCDAARRRRRRGDRDLCRGGAGAGARPAGGADRPRRRPRGGGVGARGAGRRDPLRPAPRPSSGPSPGRRYPVELRELSPVADAATRTYEARFTLPADAAAGARDERDGDARARRRGGRRWRCRPRR